MPNATGEFEIQSWNEDTYQELKNGGKLTRATVTQAFTGDLSGAGDVQWLMSYQEDGTARFVGLQQFEGSMGGRDGSFVAESRGDFDGGAASGTLAVLPGSGTGGLAGLRGDGRFEAQTGSMKAAVQLDYSFE